MDRQTAEKIFDFLSNYNQLSPLTEEEVIFYHQIEEYLKDPELSNLLNGLMRATEYEREAILSSLEVAEVVKSDAKVMRLKRAGQKDGFINALELGIISFVSFGLLVVISYFIF